MRELITSIKDDEIELNFYIRQSGRLELSFSPFSLDQCTSYSLLSQLFLHKVALERIFFSGNSKELLKQLSEAKDVAYAEWEREKNQELEILEYFKTETLRTTNDVRMILYRRKNSQKQIDIQIGYIDFRYDLHMSLGQIDLDIYDKYRETDPNDIHADLSLDWNVDLDYHDIATVLHWLEDTPNIKAYNSKPPYEGYKILYDWRKDSEPDMDEWRGILKRQNELSGTNKKVEDYL